MGHQIPRRTSENALIGAHVSVSASAFQGVAQTCVFNKLSGEILPPQRAQNLDPGHSTFTSAPTPTCTSWLLAEVAPTAGRRAPLPGATGKKKQVLA